MRSFRPVRLLVYLFKKSTNILPMIELCYWCGGGKQGMGRGTMRERGKYRKGEGVTLS